VSVKIGDLVTIAPAMTGMYLVVGEKFVTDAVESRIERAVNGSDACSIDCWLLFSAEDGWILPMGKTFVKPL